MTKQQKNYRDKYKTELCKTFELFNYCRYGNKVILLLAFNFYSFHSADLPMDRNNYKRKPMSTRREKLDHVLGSTSGLFVITEEDVLSFIKRFLWRTLRIKSFPIIRYTFTSNLIISNKKSKKHWNLFKTEFRISIRYLELALTKPLRKATPYNQYHLRIG